MPSATRVPRQLLFAVQAAVQSANVRRRRLNDALLDDLTDDIFNVRRARLADAKRQLDQAVDDAIAAGATEKDLCDYGVPASVARFAIENFEAQEADHAS